MRRSRPTLAALVVTGMFSAFPGVSSAKDLSGLYIDLLTGNPPVASMVLTDPFGRRTGINLRLGSLDDDAAYFHEIPDSNAGYEGSPANDETGEAAATGRISVGIFSAVSSGAYRVTIKGIETRNFSLDIGPRDSNGGFPILPEIPGAIAAGETQEFTFNYSPQPGSTMTITKQVTFATLRTALRTWRQLDQLGDAKFIAKLDKTLAEGEKALTGKGGKDRENRKEAVEKLRKFVRKIEKAFKSEKDDDPNEDEDKDHKDKEQDKPQKRFVSEPAFRSLKGDAEILIRNLGGKPGEDH